MASFHTPKSRAEIVPIPTFRSPVLTDPSTRTLERGDRSSLDP